MAEQASGFVLNVKAGDLMLLSLGSADERVIAVAEGPVCSRCRVAVYGIANEYHRGEHGDEPHVPPAVLNMGREELRQTARRRGIKYAFIVRVESIEAC